MTGERLSLRNLSFSTNAFTRCSLEDAVSAVAAAGYAGVELLADAPHLVAHETSLEGTARLKRIVERLGLKVANVNANTAACYYGRAFWEPLFEPSLAHPEEGPRRWRVEYTRRCIEAAAALGAPSVSITSGRPVPGILPEESLAILEDSMGELLSCAAGLGVRLGIEYEPGLLIGDEPGLSAFLDRMASPVLGANLDVGHSVVAGEDPLAVISRLGEERIVHVHLEDIRGRVHYHRIPGEGDLDFRAILAALGAAAYNGFVTVELYTYPQSPEKAARKAFRFLRNVMLSGE